jgi:hypothetical protein
LDLWNSRRFVIASSATPQEDIELGNMKREETTGIAREVNENHQDTNPGDGETQEDAVPIRE